MDQVVVRVGVMLIAVALFVASVTVLRPVIHRWLGTRLVRERAAPLPTTWQSRVTRQVPVFARLSGPEQDRLLRSMRDLLTTRTWEGCGGLDLTEDIRITIAAQACLLTLGLEGDPYPALKTILVYPSTFVPTAPFRWAHGGDDALGAPALGESWSNGIIVLAWDSAHIGAAHPADGSNVVLHEFAHQLDGANGEIDGVPRMAAQHYGPWAQLFAREFETLVRSADSGHTGILDTYATTSLPELFAVATETFFERPLDLRREHPLLYAALERYYGQDPIRLMAPGAPSTDTAA